MTRRVVFAGGIQAKALAKAYRLDIAVDRDEDVFFIGAESIEREAAHRVFAAADMVITDIGDAGETVPEKLVAPRAELIRVPVVRGDFLWPFAGRPHPANRGTSALPGGPYPADFGDSQLDRLLAEGSTADEAVQRYLAMDVADVVDLDAGLRDIIDRLAALEARTGFDLASFVADRFRAQNLFATSERLRLNLFSHVAKQVFGRMGVAPTLAAALLEAPFAPGAMPIHPSVLRHFGMISPLPDHRYPILDEGLFTFEQYCRRYVRYEWNEALHAAMALAEDDPVEAIPALRRALLDSPASRAGQLALEEAEREAAERADLPVLALSAPSEAVAEASIPVSVRFAPAASATLNARPVEAASADTSWSGLGGADTGRRDADVGDEDPGFDAAVPNTVVPFEKWSVNGPVPVPSAEAVPLSVFNAPARPSTPLNGKSTLEQQSYVELPRTYDGQIEPDAPAVAPAARGRYTPLPPAHELIEVLPRMLQGTRGLAGAADAPFSGMPETMPPPPLRPVLPPELQPEPVRRGFVAKLFGGGRG